MTAGSAGAPSRAATQVREVLRRVVRDGRDGCRCTSAQRSATAVVGKTTASACGSDGSRAQHAAGDAERSEAASAARSAREDDVAASPMCERRNGPRRPDDDAAREALRTMQRP